MSNIKKLDWYWRQGGASGEVLPSFADGAAFWLRTERLSTMFQEGGGNGGNPTTSVTADAQTVGLIYDQSVNGMIVRASADATDWPVLGSGGGRNSFLTFDGVDDRLVVQGSTLFFNPIYGPSPLGSIMFWIKCNGGDGTIMTILTNINGGTGRGFLLRRNSDNTISLFVRSTSATLYTVTSTATLTVASGWVPIIITLNGAGSNLGRIIIGEAQDSNFTPIAGQAGASTDPLYICSRSTQDTQVFNGSISDLIFRPDVATDQMITDFKAYNPTRDEVTEFTPILIRKWDMNDTTKLFSDSGATTPVTNGSVTRVVQNARANQNFGSDLRIATAASDTVAPIFRTNQVNGLGAIEFDGSDDNLDFSNNVFASLAGKHMGIIIATNQDATNGSHLMSGNGWLPLTGENYSGQFDDPYLTAHGSNGLDSGVPAPIGTVDAQYRILGFARNGTLLKSWNALKQTTDNDDADGTETLTYTDMGLEALAGWQLDGLVAYFEEYIGYDETLMEQRIDALVSQFAIPLS